MTILFVRSVVLTVKTNMYYLFYDAVSNPDYIALSGGMINE
jgi:hypothetical protein